MILADKTATDTTEHVSANVRSVLKNKDAVQSETIRRSPFCDDWEVFARENRIDNEFWREEDKPSQQDLRPSPRHPNRNRIVIREQANTVRTISNQNIGKKQKKRYSTEPTWLDRYKLQHSDEELSEWSDDEDEAYPTPDMHSWYQALRS